MAPADDDPRFGRRISSESGLPLETEAEFLAAVEEGVAAADRGEAVPLEDVLAWMRTWGTDHPLPQPRSKPR